MGKHIKAKFGDTLIEVMIAIGIFSLVAISVVAVMNSGTANIQTTLETTMTRNEIDIQAESIRFIYSSYIAEQNAETKAEQESTTEDPDADPKYTKIWKAIIAQAHDFSSSSETNTIEAITKYSPETCDELYERRADGGSNLESQRAFVINPKKIDDKDSAVVTPRQATFQPTKLYPRIYEDNGKLISDESSGDDDVVITPEGIYVVAVKDPQTSTIVVGGVPMSGQSAYYDFYIRTCWYGAGANVPSTISTVIRLYDPAIISE